MSRATFGIIVIALAAFVVGGFLIAKNGFGLRGFFSPSTTPVSESAKCQDFMFSKFPIGANDYYRGDPPTVQTATDEKKQLATLLNEGVKKESDFAGHYAVVGWGCGPTCQRHAVIDKRDGRIALFGLESTHGVSYKVNSRLLIVNPPYATIDGEPAPQKTEYYTWDEAASQLTNVCAYP